MGVMSLFTHGLIPRPLQPGFFTHKKGDSALSTSFTHVARRGIPLLLMVAGLAAVSGCALTPEDSERWRESQRPILKERAEARWAGLIKGDAEVAYSYFSPAYRGVVSLQQYKGGLGSAVNWRLARVKDIRYDSPEVASVSVEVAYRFALPLSGGEEIESVRIQDEKWQYGDGGWWYTSK
jgi:hypothetical protein